MLNPLLNSFRHYIGIACLLLLAYFLFAPLADKAISAYALKGQAVAVATQAPGNTAVSTIADAAKDTVLEAALSHQAVQLSAAQQTIANLAEQAGANKVFASGLAAGLTRPAPAVQTISVGTKAHFVPSPAPDDSQIVADVKKAMAQTPLRVDNHVTVDWKDKPTSPFFAAYNFDGATGVGYTFRKAPFLNADALLMAKSQGGTDLGVGVDHILKGTAASIGLDLTYSPQTKKFSPGVFAGIRW